MRYSRLFAAGITTAAVLVAMTGWLVRSSAQTQVAAAKVEPLGQTCVVMTDPFKGKMNGAGLPPGLLPVGDDDKTAILACASLDKRRRTAPALRVG